MARFVLIYIFCIAFFSSHAQSTIPGLRTPPDTAQLFAPGFFSPHHRIRDIAISPAGDEMYYTVMAHRNTFSAILYSKKTGKEWSAPQVAAFSGKYGDLEPAFSPDGKRLYFASNRPLNSAGDPKDYDIWYVERKGDKWSEPVNPGAPVNTSGDEFYPSAASNGNLYYTASFASGKGKEDIFISSFKDGKFTEPVSLDTAINTSQFEFNAFVAPDESYIIFSATGRKGAAGRGDLYISVKKQGKWQPSVMLKGNINSIALDYCPFVSAGNKALFFTSERTTIASHYKEALTIDKLNGLLDAPGNGTGKLYWINFEPLIKELTKQ